ncbi:head GIN domain-containing protein [Flavobacterium orientale]|uniref:DUF2807 domain-containing protein n=1 Tax=Flavobacterium orientale TaxID=1756020 RepID=A0A916Y6T2_9FLAO|nr:head GIN domain-containing protein [Flavobacterium orientale]GGD33405.1 DUF2807 domain-containing protein [Flavobacterium orientale]
MKKSITLLLLLVVTLSSGQWRQEKIKGNGNFTTKEITTSDYESVSVAGAFYVTLVEGNEGKISVKAEENLLEFIDIESKGSDLQIRTKKGYNLNPSKGKKIEITVPVKDISKVSLAGSGDIVSNFTLKATTFKASVAGSGDIKLSLDADSVQANVAGSGDIQLKGKTKNLEANVSGSGDIEAFDLQSENSKVSVSGSGNISTNCTELIEARVSGSGDIEYKGKPKKIDTKVAGSGKIKMI